MKFVTSSYTGNFQIFNKLFFDDKSIVNQLKFDLDKLSLLLNERASFSPRYHLPSLVSSGEYSLPVLAQGIRPELEKNVSTIQESVVSGKFLSSVSLCSPGEIVIGEKLARALKVDLGEKIVLLAQSADGNLGNELFRVQGLYSTGSTNFDKGYVFIAEECAKQLGVVQYPHEIVISVKNAEQEDQIFQDIKKK
ncbi:MAG: ABC transporter permease [Bdellovibrionales bacterium]|nr:ABC transporter permease [Bdellovibrionales bacterium]